MAILRQQGIQPSRAMGQNFLVDPDIVQRIVVTADVRCDDLVVEIGPGMGILTRTLLRTGADVVAVELDRELKAFLDRDLGWHPALRLVERDARHADIAELVGDRPFQVVANLPYSVATVVIRHFMEAHTAPERMTVMVQREVAERMVATAPAMSLLALATQLHADARIAFFVPREVFIPPPQIESAVVHLAVRQDLPLTRADRDRMFVLATMAFQRKRKTISNGLSQGLDAPKQAIDERLRSIDIDPQRRPQTLEVAEWLRVAAALPA
ncbi:MAG: ribosomal RNA small subunit methyltransferase A [Chloroflexia bacterium]|nr:ribosomal RNA small subunit methyltransferase A [Chloroflexia bacterium]